MRLAHLDFTFQTARPNIFAPSLRAPAKQSIAPQLTKLDCFAALAMTAGDRAASTHWLAMAAQHRSTHLRDLAARMRPSFANNYPRKRGRRECRVRAAPAVSRAKIESTRGRHHRFTGAGRHSPRNGFNGLLRDLPGDRALLSPSSCEYGWSAPGRADSPPQNLTPASRRQDHTTSPSASAPFVCAR